MPGLIHVFGGGTVTFIRNHLALCAPAYGHTARALTKSLADRGHGHRVRLHLTKMADWTSSLETNNDVATCVQEVLANPDTRAIVFNVALCDYEGQIGDTLSGKYAQRLQSREGPPVVMLSPAPKILGSIKTLRPDVFLVGFKTTAGDTPVQQEAKAHRQIAETGVNWVWANDTVTRVNFITDGTRQMPPSHPEGVSRNQLIATLADYLGALT